MVINNKYNIGDKVLCVRNGRIEEIVIGNFSLDWNKSKTLHERLQYEEERESEILTFNVYKKTTFHESELYTNVEECLLHLKKNFELSQNATKHE